MAIRLSVQERALTSVIILIIMIKALANYRLKTPFQDNVFKTDLRAFNRQSFRHYFYVWLQNFFFTLLKKFWSIVKSYLQCSSQKYVMTVIIRQENKWALMNCYWWKKKFYNFWFMTKIEAIRKMENSHLSKKGDSNEIKKINYYNEWK